MSEIQDRNKSFTLTLLHFIRMSLGLCDVIGCHKLSSREPLILVLLHNRNIWERHQTLNAWSEIKYDREKS